MTYKDQEEYNLQFSTLKINKLILLKNKRRIAILDLTKEIIKKENLKTTS
jgi:hypothetical protein